MLDEDALRTLSMMYEDFKLDLEPLDLLVHFQVKSTFSESQIERIKGMQTRRERVGEFLRTYRRVGRNLTELTEAIEEEYPHLAARIRKLEKDDDKEEEEERDEARSGKHEDEGELEIPQLTPNKEVWAKNTSANVKKILATGQVPGVHRHVQRVGPRTKLVDSLLRNSKLVHGMPGSGKSALVAEVLKNTPGLFEPVDKKFGAFESVVWLRVSEGLTRENLALDFLFLLVKEMDGGMGDAELRSQQHQSLAWIRKQIVEAFVDRPNLLVVLDGVSDPKTVEWFDSFPCRILATTRNAELFDAIESRAVEIITIGGWTELETAVFFASRDWWPSTVPSTQDPQPQDVIRIVHRWTDGLPGAISALEKLADKKLNRLFEFTRRVQRQGPAALRGAKALSPFSVGAKLADALKKEALAVVGHASEAGDILAGIAVFPPSIWIPAEMFSLVLPLDTCDQDDALLDTESILSGLAKRAVIEQYNEEDYEENLLRKGSVDSGHEEGENTDRDDEGDENRYRIPRLVHLLLNNDPELCDPKVLEALRTDYLTRLEELSSSGDGKFPQARRWVRGLNARSRCGTPI